MADLVFSKGGKAVRTALCAVVFAFMLCAAVPALAFAEGESTSADAGGAAPHVSAASTASEAGSSSAATQLTLGDADSARDAVLPSGTYILQSALPGQAMLDVQGGSKASGASVQLYHYNKTDAQRWRLVCGEDGLYTICNLKSGCALELSQGRARAGQIVWQHAENGSLAQKWSISRTGTGYRIASAQDSRYVLDAAGGKSADGTRVQLWKRNDTAAQRWWIFPEAVQLASERTVEDGVYEMLLAKDERWALDLNGQSFANGAKVQLWQRNGSVAQRWAITWEKDGYYSIRNVSSGKPLDVAYAGRAARTNIQQYASNGTDAQRWALEGAADGTFVLVSKLTGLALDVQAAQTAKGTKVLTYPRIGGASQRLTLKPADVLPEGVYNMFSLRAPTSQVADITGGSKQSGTQAQLWSGNGSMAQKFQFRRTAANTYAIQNVYSGQYLADASGKLVQRTHASASAAQHWRAVFEGNGVALVNVATGRRMDTSGQGGAKGTKLVTQAAVRANSQHWRIVETPILPAKGRYLVRNIGGMLLDVAGASFAHGANIQVYKANGSAAQCFDIAHMKGGYYKISNAAAGKAVEVAGGTASDGANVRQGTWTGSAAQLWRPLLRQDGALAFVNRASGKVLDVAGGSKASGANVQSYHANGSAAQGWSLAVTKLPSLAGKKVVYLTFDDGPSQHTARLLRILDKYKVKATFFVVHGNGAYVDLIADEAKAGHTVAVHTYTHDFSSIYASPSAFWNDFNRMRNEIHAKTGTWTNMFRFAGGSSNTISRFNPGIMTRLVADAKKKGYRYFDWNAGGIDAGGTTSSAAVASNAISGMRSNNPAVVLLHDSKGYTVDAVETIIRWGLANGYVFMPLTESGPGAHHTVQN